MAEQGGPNLTGKKGHFETNKVEGDRAGVLGSTGATEAGVGSSSVSSGRYEGGVEPQGGPSMTANLDHRKGVPRYKGPRGVAENLHTDTSLRPVRAAAPRPEERSFDSGARPSAIAIDDIGDPNLGPRGDPAEGRSGPYEAQDSGDPWLGARGDPAEGRRDDDFTSKR